MKGRGRESAIRERKGTNLGEETRCDKEGEQGRGERVGPK